MPKILSSKPWLLIVLLLAVFLASWVVLISIASKHQPKEVPVGR